jgi:hypothetical protein
MPLRLHTLYAYPYIFTGTYLDIYVYTLYPDTDASPYPYADTLHVTLYPNIYLPLLLPYRLGLIYLCLYPIDIYLLYTNPIPTNLFLSLSSSYYPIRSYPDYYIPCDPDYTDMIDIHILDAPSLLLSVYLYSLDPNIAFSLLYIFRRKS